MLWQLQAEEKGETKETVVASEVVSVEGEEVAEAVVSKENKESLQSDSGTAIFFVANFTRIWMCIELHCTGWEIFGRYGFAIDSFVGSAPA